ncbi:MAG: class I SAM-dependent methyltransferase [Hyphomicrobiales bacterium]
MTATDKVFAGSIPANYDRYLGPLLFEPYATDLAARAAALAPLALLETAAGTGIVTKELVKALPKGALITATDLNQGMIDVAAAKVNSPNVHWRACDATRLPFADNLFDAVLCRLVSCSSLKRRGLQGGSTGAEAGRNISV